VTQGICKGLFFERFSPGLLRHRKFMLMADALGVDLKVSKDKQLRIFMNRAYLGDADGHEVLGFQAAAKAYFGRDLLQLNDREYLSLVAMLVAPNAYHVVSQPEANAERVRVIERLVEAECGRPNKG
jgi:membrane peptidoglycan carboxypeptidase